jgi:hypothetical protein
VTTHAYGTSARGSRFNLAMTEGELMETNAHFEITDLSDLVRRRIKAAQCKAGDQTIILEQSKASNGSLFL